MIKYVNTMVTFTEVPDEISLCVNLSNCPHRCIGCHSPELQNDIGEELTKESLTKLIEQNNGITCVCFMGGDNDIPQLTILAEYVRIKHKLKTAWYTGLNFPPQPDRHVCNYFDYIKTGPYIERFGPLNSPDTNQRFYTKGSSMHKMDANPHMWYDTTDKFWKNDADTN